MLDVALDNRIFLKALALADFCCWAIQMGLENQEEGKERKRGTCLREIAIFDLTFN